MVVSLLGAKVRGNESSSYLLDHPVGDELKIFMTITILIVILRLLLS